MQAILMLFVLMVIVLFFGAHYFIYFCLIKFFYLTNSTLLQGLFILFCFLAVSYLIAYLWSHLHISIWSRCFYYASGFWIGWLIYLFLACLLLLILNYFFSLNNLYFSLSLILFSLGISIYGAYNADQLTTHHLRVKINKLPEYWRGKNIVQISDLHLGPWYRENFAKKIVKLINAEHPDLVVITGDYFDGIKKDDQELVTPLKELKSTEGTYFVFGNHDIFYSREDAHQKIDGTGVKILLDQAVEIKGLQILGADYRGPEVNGKADLQELLKLKNPLLPTILLSHIPNNLPAIADAEIDLLLAGHTHRGQQWPYNYLTRAIFGKYHIGLNKLNQLWVYVSPGAGSWGPAVRIGNRPEIAVITLE